MEYREVKAILCVQKVERPIEHLFVTSILAPPIVMFVDIRPVDFPHGQIFPLDTGVQYIQNVIKYLVVGERWRLSARTCREVRLDVSVKLFARDLCR